MKRYSMVLDFDDDPYMVTAYKAWHELENGWQEVNPKF